MDGDVSYCGLTSKSGTTRDGQLFIISIPVLLSLMKHLSLFLNVQNHLVHQIPVHQAIWTLHLPCGKTNFKNILQCQKLCILHLNRYIGANPENNGKLIKDKNATKMGALRRGKATQKRRTISEK